MMYKANYRLKVGVCLLLAVVALSLTWLRVGINQHPVYHQWVETQVSQAIGQEVSLESFELKLIGTRLQLNLEGIGTEQDLTLSRLVLGLDLWPLVTRQTLNLTYVQATGLAVNISQGPNGTWGPGSANESLPTLMLGLVAKVPQLQLKDVGLTFVPKQGRPVTIPQLNARVALVETTPDGINRLALSLFSSGENSILKEHLKVNLAVNITTQGSIEQVQAYINSKGLDVTTWLPLVMPEEPLLSVNKARFRGDYWIDYQANSQLKIAAKKAHIQLSTPDHEVNVSGGLSAFSVLDGSLSQGWQLANGHLSAYGLNGHINNVPLPMADVQIHLHNQHLEATSSQLNLLATQTLLNTISSIPKKVNLPIQSLAPKGLLSQAKFHLNLKQPKEFLFAGAMHSVSINPWAGVPEISQADGQIWLNRYGGKVAIDDSDGLQLRIPTLNSQPWQLDQLRGEFNWHYGPLQNRFSSSNMEINVDEGHMNFKMAAKYPRRGSSTQPFIQLALGIQNFDLTKLSAKLPDLVMGQQLGEWLTMATSDGAISEAALIYNGRPGAIADPQQAMARSMPIAASINAPNLRYHPDWPLAQGLLLDLSVDHTGALLEAKAGVIKQGEVSQNLEGWQVKVPVYAAQTDKHGVAKQRFIAVHGRMAGSAKQMMTLAQDLPIHLKLPQWLRTLRPAGEVALVGQVDIPFGHASKVGYNLTIASDDLSGYWAPLKVNLQHVELEVKLNSSTNGVDSVIGNGLADGQKISFKSLSKADIAKPWLDQLPSTISDTLTSKRNDLSLQFEGRMPSSYLATKFHQPWAQEVPGELPFVVRMSSCHGDFAPCTLLSAEVDLTQAQITLPKPLDQLQQLQLLGEWQEDYQHWYVGVDGHQAALVFASPDNRLLGVNIGFQQAVDWPQQGQWSLNGQIDFIDLEPWAEVYQTRIKTWFGDTEKQHSYVVSPQINVKVKQAIWHDLSIDQATIDIQPLIEAGDFAINQPLRMLLTSEQLAGKVDYFGPDHPLAIKVSYAHLNFPEADEDDESTADDLLENIDPGKFPNADVSIDELLKNGESFGQWQFKTRSNGVQVNVHDLDAQLRHSHLQGNLIWNKKAGIHHTQFTGRVESEDMSALLVDWGYDPALSAEKASMEVQLEWPHSPLAFAVKDITGDLALRFRKGSFSSSPRAAQGLRILALLDMSRLMKRVQLDFSDIVQPGFSFDNISVHYRFEDGYAATVAPLVLKSTALNLSMDGWIDFDQRLVDNNLIVTLPVAEKLPLVALLAGLPQLSGMIYIANKLIGDELATFTSARYSVAGSLDNPDVNLVKMFDKDYQQQTITERIENVISIE